MKMRKLTYAIQYHDEKSWVNWQEGDEKSINLTWNAMQCGYCNDDLIALQKQTEAANGRT